MVCFFFLLCILILILYLTGEFPFETDVLQHTTPPCSKCETLSNIPAPLTHAEHEKTPHWCLFVLSTLPHLCTHAEHEKTPLWCLFMLDAFIHVLMHAEHKKTPMLVSFRARHLFQAI